MFKPFLKIGITLADLSANGNTLSVRQQLSNSLRSGEMISDDIFMYFTGMFSGPVT